VNHIPSLHTFKVVYVDNLACNECKMFAKEMNIAFPSALEGWGLGLWSCLHTTAPCKDCRIDGKESL
jgi:hypothetical protein